MPTENISSLDTWLLANTYISFTNWLSIIALFLGPVIAICVTRIIDSKRERKNRRLELFKILMRTRGTRLNPEHVGALNLIEIEYYQEKRVLYAVENYFQHLNNKSHMPAEFWLTTSGHLLTKLLYAMANSLGYKIDQLQILTGGYAPQGWEEAERKQIEVQDKILQILDGKRAFPIFQFTSDRTQATPTTSVASPFPPKPTV